ncbi:hypothetical protein K505DRAFT_418011 [Melanomma pulvis-pyrius CBS 109.77]|uniref:CFEM domain-containing protein n=1 Tax=Melanomma pulvis-pyrius CBS 109.77 TaxID=1314802 RepID=A0A6A6XAQ4_9PLEO|nr:hypothetical protein K505DRAFT_418011 [Melanomma pulvis-pyrius CBS 109.77]
MKPLLLLVLAGASAMAQSVLDYTKLPSCARQCVVLAQAEGGCIPPAAPVDTQQTYQSCVCQSALLTGLHQSGAQCQATGCSADDAAKISTYYNALCSGPVVVPAPAATTTTATTSSATATGTAAAGAAGGNKTATQGKTDWLSTHWKWVVMVIIIFVAILFFWIGGAWLKRRHDRKRDAARANMAAHDAPYNPPPPGAQRSLTSIMRGSSSKVNASASTVNGSAVHVNGTPAPPMTAMSGRSGMAMDGGVGGIAPPRGPTKLRSRSSTLQSLGLSNGSKAHLPDPVAWGPHQYQAFYNVNHQGSPGNSIPPSPTSAMTPPHPAFRNRESTGSEQRFVQYKATPTSISVESLNYSAHPNGTPLMYDAEMERPRTAGAVDEPGKSCETTPVRPSRANNDLRIVSFDETDRALNDRVNVQPQSAEICQASPQKALNAH